MSLAEIVDALSLMSARGVALGLRNPSKLRRFLSHSLKTYDEMAGVGLPAGAPVVPAENDTITLPAFHSGGGMSFEEMVHLARVTRVLKPKTIFEMGSFDGLTTALFVLNSEANARIFTLDLPPGEPQERADLTSDQKLVASRRPLAIPQALGLSRYTQILCDSMQFDPTPYADSVDLGLVDAAHDLIHVRNDTIKMARMMSENGMVLWHDYGGKGALRPLATYLETLGKQCPLFRIPSTTLAWAHARELKAVVGR